VLIVLASGVLPGSVGAAAPVREWPAGALDPGFASGGVLTASFGTTAGPQEGRDAAIQPDGKIIVLTTSASGDYLSRYLPNGEPDTTFGNSGTVAHPIGQSSFSALTLDAQGRIVVIGGESAPPWQAPDKSLELNRGHGVVYRFLPDGSPDSSFGTNGKTVIAIPPPKDLTPGSAVTYPSAALATSDGGITVGGAVSSICAWEVGEIRRWWEESGTFVARLSPDGSLESQFGSSGLVSTHGRCKVEPGAAPETISGLVQPSPESVLVLSNHPEDNTWRFRTYSPTGALSEVQAPPEGEPPAQIAVVGDQYLVLSIHCLYAGVDCTEVLRRFNAQGVPDSTFGTNGRVTIPMSCEFGPGCFTVLPDGRILVAGRVSGGQVGVRRYLADGSPDDSFGGGGAWAELPGGNEMDTVNKLLSLHGQPLVVGAEEVPGYGYADNQTALTLFQADGGFTPNPPPPGEEPFSPIPHETGGNSGGGVRPILGPPDPPVFRHPSVINHSTNGGRRSSPSSIQAALAASLNLRRPFPTISSLLKTGGYSLNFNAPGPGALTIQWTVANAQASRLRHKRRPIIVASGAKTFSVAGHGMITLHLTAAGRKLLRKAHTLSVKMQVSFKLSDGNTQTKQSTLTLRLGKSTRH
jgi:uncharacterized delta-60 repeat protein